ncbi:MAG: triose-phosphate isomerase, partial [Firmicutes bacterium]|nr:triose-phosphate isomerase [Bacillota bacterium]
ALMIKEAGAKYALLGESEYGMFDNINLKALSALEQGLFPIIRVGETLTDRNNFKTETVLKRQTIAALKGIPERYIKNIIMAYVPVWAIGSNRYASVAEASGAIMDIRSAVLEMYSGLAAESIQMIYGGRVNSSNAANLLATRNIDGVIIGRASLNPSDFYNIVKCVRA